MTNAKRFTIAHVTHEAVEKVGGIGTVLEGLITSPEYQAAVRRSIVVGSMGGHYLESPYKSLGSTTRLLYSSIDGIDKDGFGRRLRPIEWAFDVRIAYGVRRYHEDIENRVGDSEVLLIDVSNPNTARHNRFKGRLWERYGIDAARYERDWGFEEYSRLAEPSFYALSALLRDEELPCFLFSHEFMGLPPCYKAEMDGNDAFRTVFHAHECSTARAIVEREIGHDTAFYNIMRQARERGLFLEDVFGSQSSNMRHALISRVHHLDAVAAVGDYTADELRFLNDELAQAKVEVVYNGTPARAVSLEEKLDSRSRIDAWAERVAGFRPDLLMTHVARPVVSKGFWRDLKVASHLDAQLAEREQRALLIILTCGAPHRSFEQVEQMSRDYGWPMRHRTGFPDLSGPETEIWHAIEPFNATHTRLQVAFVNQFGWSRDRLGSSLDAGATFSDLRRATDLEFGQSIYEPFGIAQVEPLSSGAICVISSVCGCLGAFRQAAESVGMTADDHPNLVVADYTTLDSPWSIDDLKSMSQRQRDDIESSVARIVAEQILRRLPLTNEDRRRLLETGSQVASRMGWDSIVRDSLLPMLDAIR
ncbi:MAG: hypothetical protein ACF8PN_15490 [Phycisphaerales bacterium]